MSNKESKPIYVAIKYVPRTAPKISWTKTGIASLIGCHRNSLVFKYGAEYSPTAYAKGWIVYKLEIEPTIGTLKRSK
jgi:hypothetical protein